MALDDVAGGYLSLGLGVAVAVAGVGVAVAVAGARAGGGRGHRDNAMMPAAVAAVGNDAVRWVGAAVAAAATKGE